MMVRVDKRNAFIYFERAKDCYNAIKSLQIINYETELKPDYLKRFQLKNYDVIYMLYSISVISLLNCLTIHYLGEKAKDHNDLSLYKNVKKYKAEVSKFDKIIFEINNIKNSSEYGDKHYNKHDEINTDKLMDFIEFVDECL